MRMGGKRPRETSAERKNLRGRESIDNSGAKKEVEKGNINRKKRRAKEKALCQKQDTGALSTSLLILITSGS